MQKYEISVYIKLQKKNVYDITKKIFEVLGYWNKYTIFALK